MSLDQNSDVLAELLTQVGKVLLQEQTLSKPVSSLSIYHSKKSAYPLARFIDHTLLKPEATSSDIQILCEEAKLYGFASVCVNSSYVSLCSQYLENTEVAVCSVVGFPLGAMSTNAKVFEAKEAVYDGAQEVDMVVHIGALKAKKYGDVLSDIQAVVKATSPARVKVILETGALTHEEKIIGALLSKLAGAHFVKTSTGFGKGGAKAEDVALLRSIVGTEMGVKASGGIRNREDAERMLLSGANRLGTSASVAIVTEELIAQEIRESAHPKSKTSGEY